MSKLRAHSLLAKKVINSRSLVVAVISLCLLAGASGIARSSLIDWDEGVFALQAQWLATMGAAGKPFNFQTPPLFQIIIAVIFSLVGINGYVLPFISLACSGISLYVLYRIGTLLFSEREGLYAMVLFAASEFFLFFSRSGLSDALFLCLFLASLLSFLKGLLDRRKLFFLSAGILMTAACYTKYSAFPLILSFFLIGIFWKGPKTLRQNLFTALLPVVLFIPYIIVFVNVVHAAEITARHAPLLGIHHLKYLHYLLVYSPVPLCLTVIALLTRRRIRKTWLLFLIMGIYFVFVGCYHPFFRLAYPLTPLLALVGSLVIERTEKFRNCVFVLLIAISLLFGYRTIVYGSRTPRDFVEDLQAQADHQDADFVYALAPPNITFYISHDILVPVTHPWAKLENIFPALLSQKRVIYPEVSILTPQTRILLVHASIFDSLRTTYADIFAGTTRLSKWEFVDAPVYNKDPYNPLRNSEQFYELYSVNPSSLFSISERIWHFGFERNVTVMEINE